MQSWVCCVAVPTDPINASAHNLWAVYCEHEHAYAESAESYRTAEQLLLLSPSVSDPASNSYQLLAIVRANLARCCLCAVHWLLSAVCCVCLTGVGCLVLFDC